MRENRPVIVLPLIISAVLLMAIIWGLGGATVIVAESSLHPLKNPDPAISIAKAVDLDETTPGGHLIYTLLVTNTGDVTATAIVVTDTLPDALVISASNPPSTTQSGATVTWEFQEIASGDSITIVLTTTVSSPLPDGFPIVNVATAICSGTTPVESEPVTVIVRAPAFALSKQAHAPAVQPGNWITYVLLLTNTGHLTLTEPYTILEQLPNYTHYITSAPLPSESNDALVWVFAPPLPPDAATVVTLVLSVTEPLTHGWLIVNEEYSASSPAVNPSVNGPAVTVSVESAYLEMGKTVLPVPALPGSPLTYTLGVTNIVSARGAAVDLIVTDVFPISTTFGSCTGGERCAQGAGNWVTWTISSLPPGRTEWLTLTVNVLDRLSANSWLTNQVTLTAQGIEPLTATTVVSVAHVPAVALAADQEGSVFPGQAITYIHTLTNTGNGKDTFSLTVGGLPDGWGAEVEPYTASLAAGASTPVTVTVQTPADALSGTVATAVVTATSGARPSVFATVNDQILIVQRAGVALAPNREGAVFPGETITYTHILTNTGNGTDTFGIELSSSQQWATLVGPSSFTLGAGMTTTLQVRVEVPSGSSGLTEITVITATSQAGAGPVVVTDTTTVKFFHLFLPLVIRNYPPAWTRLAGFPQNLTVYSLGICGQYFYAGTSDGVYVSNNGGTSWQQHLKGNLVRGVAVHPVTCTMAYATTWGNYVYKTRNGGGNWSQLSSGLGDKWAYALAFSPDGQRIYLGTANRGVYQANVRSSDDNEQWFRSTPNLDKAVPGLTVTSTVTYSEVVYAAVWGEGIYWFNGAQWSPWSPQPDRYALKAGANPANGTLVFVGTNTGFFRWTGTEWKSLAPTARTFDFAYYLPLNRIYAAQESNGVLVSIDGGDQWTPMNTGMVPLPQQVRCLVIHRGFLYAGTTNGIWQYPLVP